MKEWFAKFVEAWLGTDQLTALLLVAFVSAVFGFVGRALWAGMTKYYEQRRFGGWTLVVLNGKSRRNWKAPLDKEVVRHLKKKSYFAFKRDLGTAISGDIHLNFSFGVELNSTEVLKKEPQASGMTIDHVKKTITVDCATTQATP